METCWKSETIFNIIRPRSNIYLVSDTLPRKTLKHVLKKIDLWIEVSTQNLISAFPSGRRSWWRLRDCPVESCVGVSRHDRAVRVFWRPLFCFVLGMDRKRKWFQIDKKTHYDIQTERKKEKREKRTINFSLISGRCVQQSYRITVYEYYIISSVRNYQ